MGMWLQGNLFFRWEEPEPVVSLWNDPGLKGVSDVGERGGILKMRHL